MTGSVDVLPGLRSITSSESDISVKGLETRIGSGVVGKSKIDDAGYPSGKRSWGEGGWPGVFSFASVNMEL